MNVNTDVPNHHHRHDDKPTRIFKIKGLILPLFALTSLSLLLHNSSSLPNPVSISSQCTIISSSVDIRSSQVCELGFFNYKAKNVFYPSQTSKFRCRHDYYWASVFKVEYREYTSGLTRRALAEAPKEALPIDCRPNFTLAWLTKEKFKVNGTYSCRYTPGISEVDIYSDNLFNCHAKDPSILEMINRYFILFMRIMYSLAFGERMDELGILELVSGIFAGIFTGFMSVILITFLQIRKARLAKNSEATRVHSAITGNRLKRVFFLVVYLILMGWLTMQYGNMVGLNEIFTNL